MKKITFLIASLVMGVSAIAQVTLSQSVDPSTIDAGGVACWNSGNGEYRDNTFARTYDLSEFGIVDGFSISAVEFGQGSADEGKVVTVIISTVDTEDLSSAVFEDVATLDVTLSAADDLSLITATFPEAVNVPADAIVAVQVFAPDAELNVGETFFPGFNLAGENSTPWLRSDGTGTGGANVGCEIPWSDANSIVADQNYVINLVGEDVLSVNQVELSQISVYPNPASDVLFVKVPSTIELTGSTLFDVLGKNSGVSVVVNGQMNISDLARGVYILNLQTTAGTLTQKVVIE